MKKGQKIEGNDMIFRISKHHSFNIESCPTRFHTSIGTGQNSSIRSVVCHAKRRTKY